MNDNPQRNHYINVHDDYATHYYDKTSMSYRKRFIYSHLYRGLDLNGKNIADLASGSGANSIALIELYPDVNVTGFDISPVACGEYDKNIGRPAHEIDLTKTINKYVGQYDAAIVIGGLHHCIIDLQTTMENISKILKPGGMLLMLEPSSRFFLEKVRKIWYQHDEYFHADTEHALDHDEILALVSERFEPVYVKYVGGLGYFFILNSMIFRFPIGIKRWLAPPLFLLEYLLSIIPMPSFYPVFIAQWRKLN